MFWKFFDILNYHGMVNFNLTCFNSVCVMDQFLRPENLDFELLRD